jgi:hypothetical protein
MGGWWNLTYDKGKHKTEKEDKVDLFYHGATLKVKKGLFVHLVFCFWALFLSSENLILFEEEENLS